MEDTYECACGCGNLPWGCTRSEAQAEIARLQAELDEANSCHETALNLARAGTEHIAMLQAEVERLSGDVVELTAKVWAHEGMTSHIVEAADTAWNDAIEAAAGMCDTKSVTPMDAREPEYYTALGYELAAEAIRALRKP